MRASFAIWLVWLLVLPLSSRSLVAGTLGSAGNIGNIGNTGNIGNNDATLHPTAQGQDAPVTQEAPPCSAVEYRQFDFWVGDWDVKNADGQIVGTNRVERILGGCALQENWTGAGGSEGHSFNIYDRSTGRWHQTWVDNGGLLLQLDGKPTGDTMTLRGQTTDREGATVVQQISWQVRLDGSVRQHWQSSKDGGQTWSTVFDGIYERKRP